MRVQPFLLTRPILTPGLPVSQPSAPAKSTGSSSSSCCEESDSVEISIEAAALLAAEESSRAVESRELAAKDQLATEEEESEAVDPDEETAEVGDDGQKSEAKTEQSAGETELTDEEADQVRDLSQRDSEVRTHEQAHLAAAGPHARGGPTYEYQQGPDGKRYAIGGEVQIDVSPVDGDPEATIAKMQTVRAAALAPAEPSAQDRRVAATATQTESQARAELLKQRTETQTNSGNPQIATGESRFAVSAYQGESTRPPALDLVA